MTVHLFKDSIVVEDTGPYFYISQFGNSPDDEPLDEFHNTETMLMDIISSTDILCESGIITPWQRLGIIDSTQQCIAGGDSPTGQTREIHKAPTQGQHHHRIPQFTCLAGIEGHA